MDVLFFIVLMIGLAAYALHRRKGGRSEPSPSALSKAEQTASFPPNCSPEEDLSRLAVSTRALTEPHLTTLIRKRSQLLYEDDYGRPIWDDWNKEVSYFVRQILLNSKVSRVAIAEEHILCEIVSRYVEEEAAQRQTRHVPNLNPAILDYQPNMSGEDFECLLQNAFRDCGARVRRTPATGDQGVDLLVEYSGRTIAVQCKRSSSPVGNSAVQEVVAGQLYYEADEAWVVSDADFTKAARQLAGSLSVHLVDYSTLHERLRKLDAA